MAVKIEENLYKADPGRSRHTGAHRRHPFGPRVVRPRGAVLGPHGDRFVQANPGLSGPGHGLLGLLQF